MQPLESVRDISRIAYGFMSSQALFAALEIGVFTALQGEPSDVETLAARLDVRVEGLSTLMAVLRIEGLVSLVDDERFANSPAAERYLVRGAREDYSEYLRLQVGRQFYAMLPQAVAGLRGDKGAMAAEGQQGWLAEPGEAELFSRSQHAGSLGPAWQLAKRIDLEGRRSLLDVAGGSGAFSITLCAQNPDLRATILDFPTVVQIGRQFVDEAGMSDRIGFISGNALEVEWPHGQDLVLMSYLLGAVPGAHHEDLCARAWNATGPGGRVVIHDFMLDDDRSGPLGSAQWFFCYLPTTLGAISFTGADVKVLLEEAGFVDVAVDDLIPTLTKVVSGVKGE